MKSCLESFPGLKGASGAAAPWLQAASAVAAARRENKSDDGEAIEFPPFAARRNKNSV
jgi:hypothetical protein